MSRPGGARGPDAEGESPGPSGDELYRQFFDDDLTGNFLSSIDGRLLECNQAFLDVFGFASKKEALATPIEELHESPKARQALLDRLRRAGEVRRHRLSVVRANGERRELVANLVGQFDEKDRLTHVRGYVLDITENLQMEAQLLQAQKMEAVGRLAGGVAHDFNNLLAVILSYASFVKEAVAERQDVAEDVDQIVEAAERAARLTDQLLAFSRRRISHPEPVDIAEVVRGIDTMLRRVIGEDVSLESRIADELPMVRADRAQIEQVLMNLAVNARDAMPEGGTLLVEAEARKLGAGAASAPVGLDDGAYVAITVGDTGVGMDEDTLAHIWEPFFSTKGQGRGSGLGLATAYAVVEQLGGAIEVESEPGRGSTFTILLPVVGRERVELGGEDEGAEEPIGGGETVLVVEDEAGVREITRRILAGAGYRVLTAANAGEALLLCERHGGPVHLLLSDVVMPHMSGPELTRRASVLRPGLRVLFMTGYAGEASSRALDSAHGEKVLMKPFTRPDLLAAVRAALRDSGEHRRVE